MSNVIDCLLSAIAKDLSKGPLSYSTSQCSANAGYQLRIGIDQTDKMYVIVDKPNTRFVSATVLKDGSTEEAVKEVVFSLLEAVLNGEIEDPEMFTSDNDRGTRFLVTREVPVKPFHEIEFLKKLAQLKSTPQKVKDKLHPAIKYFLDE